jgi:regulator of sigma E protease
MSILIFIVILVVLILVHEFGHFIVAKKTGIRVDEFGIGFPPKALTLGKIGETEYTLNWLPIGGFVKIFGESVDEESMSGPDSARSFVNKSKWIQSAVLVAGVGFNVLLAWVLFSVGFAAGMPVAIDENNRAYITEKQVVIAEVVAGTPAERAGLAPGDEILNLTAGDDTVDEITIDNISEFTSSRGGEEISITYGHFGEVFQTTAVPIAGLVEGEPEVFAIGIAMGDVGKLQLPLFQAFIEGAKFTGQMLVYVIVAIATFLANAVVGSADLSQIAGPVGIVGLVGDYASLGFISLISFTALISLNLAVINLIPFPALDGGRLLFVIIEGIKGSPIRSSITNSLNMIGFVLLSLLLVVVTYSDILRIITG